ncbi:MAG: hypothetical protein KME52_28430 [Desmonostoc geniculatum HA4340-LM1]|jgi:hypothetical protein|nr:hypothetical protein [Desmonostoc geniculatum HA4340-LM1]
MRVSIKSHNRVYLSRIAAQIECDHTEAINYLLIELRKIGYSFGANIPSIQQSQMISDSVVKVVSQPLPTIPDTLPQEVMEEIDPIIERLINLGVCNEF